MVIHRVKNERSFFMDIKKKVIRYVNPLPGIVRPTKVAAYCRVSTLQEIQHRNLEIQQRISGISS